MLLTNTAAYLLDFYSYSFVGYKDMGSRHERIGIPLIRTKDQHILSLSPQATVAQSPFEANRAVPNVTPL